MKKLPFQKGLWGSLEKYSNKIAMQYSETEFSYDLLKRRASCISNHIIGTGVKKGSFIGVYIHNKIDFITTVIGILLARCAFVPLDTRLPLKRVENLISFVNLQVIFSDVVGNRQLSHLGDNFKTIVVDDLFYKVNDPDSSSLANVQYNREDRIYIYFTSGSSGSPNAIVGKNKSLLHFINWEIQHFGINETFRISQFSAPGFDAFLRDVFVPLFAGGTVCIPPNRETLLNSEALIKWINNSHVNLIHCVPGIFRLFNQKTLVPRDFRSLKYVLMAGETLHPAELKNWYHRFGDRIQLVNLYGTSETTMSKTCYFIREEDTNKKVIPVGQSIKGAREVILDNNMRICDQGMVGEIYIRTPYQTFGYLNNPQLTHERFIPNPFNNDPGDLIHKTGDLGRRLPDGNVEFLGRVDQQVKIRGIRVELEEIENALLKYSGVKEVVVTVMEEESDDKRIAAYILLESDVPEKKLWVPGLRKFLSEKLPDYMIPTYFVRLESVPLTPHGKVDVSALPTPEIKPSQGYIAPRNQTEVKMVEIWSEALGVPKKIIGINSNFFELGGHSLKATVAAAKIHKAFNVKLSLLQIFRTPNIRELSQYITNLNETGDHRYTALEPVEKKEYYILSPGQKRLYFIQQMLLNSTAYNMPKFIPLAEKLNVDKMEEAFQRLIKRHESFRTSFHMTENEPVQKVHHQVDFKIEYYELATESTEEKTRITHHSFVRPFDLSGAPLLRVVLSKTGEGSHILFIDLHHIVSDAVSHDILIREFFSLSSGEKLPWPRLQYKDYAEWMNYQRQKELIKQQESYWLNKFADEFPVLNLPLDYPRPVIQSFEGGRRYFVLSDEETNILNNTASENNVTLYMVTLAIFNILLSKLSGQEDIIIGTPIAGRRHADLENLVGMFVNILAARNYPSGEKTFTGFLKEVKEEALDIFENQEYQFEELVENISTRRDTSRNPIFDIYFNFLDVLPQGEFENIGDSSDKKGTPAVQHEDFSSKFDLGLLVVDQDQGLLHMVEYCTTLFNASSIERFITYYRRLISLLAANAGQKISDLEIISWKEKRQILFDFNNTSTEYPKDKTIHQLYEEQVEITPDHIALTGKEEGGRIEDKSENVSLTYKELNEHADRLAHLLKDKGARPDTIVAILIERSPAMLIGILGILKSGSAYLPIDPDYPQDRIDYILEDSCTRFLVSVEGGLSKLSEETEFIDLNKIEFSKDFAKPATHPTHLTHITQPSLAYVIYTSGTTGKPKGTLITHFNVIRVVRNSNYIDITKRDRILQLSNYAFDGSVFDIYGALLNGAALILIKKEDLLEVNKLVDLIEKEKISVFFVTTALFNTMTDLEINCFKAIRKVLFGGEKVSVPHTKKLLEYIGKDKIIHVYGPTESTVFATYFQVNEIGENAITIPIGKPLSNTTLYIVDQSNKLLPPGVFGELCIGGDGIARGYLNNPELTLEKFKRVISSYGKLPKASDDQWLMPDDPLYRTGDIVRWLPGANIEFSGRIDQQVKIRGFRIELAEIENELLKHQEIEVVIVIARETQTPGGNVPPDQGEKYLCAYIVSNPHKAIDTPGLKKFLSLSLPDYMIPSFFVQLEKIPLNPNGKVDRRSLPEPQLETTVEYEAPRDEIEKKMVIIWAHVLGRDLLKASQAPTIGINDDFFQLGGHSLRAVTLLSRIHKELDVKIPLTEIFKRPTIKELSGFIKASRKERFTAIGSVEKKEYYPLSSAQKRLYILQHTQRDNLSYNVSFAVLLEGKPRKERLDQAFEKLIRRHESLRTSFEMTGTGPIQIIHDDVDANLSYYETNDDDAQELINTFVRPFDLDQVPLLRVIVVKVEESRFIVMLDMHHIITDGTSMSILNHELMALYGGKELAPLRIQYKDFSEWQNSEAQRQRTKEVETYWLKQFEGEVPVLNLPIDYIRPETLSMEGHTIAFELDARETTQLKQMATEEGMTLYMVLLSLFNVLLSMACDQEDILIGAPLAGRRHADLEQIIGFFVNMLPLRNFPGDEKKFYEFLMEVKKRTLAAYENQDYPFEDLVDNILSRRNSDRSSLVDVVFVFQNMEVLTGEISDVTAPTTPGLRMRPYEWNKPTSPFDLILLGSEQGDILHFAMQYKTKLFKEQTIRMMIKNFKELVSIVLHNKQVQLKDIKISHDLLTLTSDSQPEDQGDFEFFDE